jgi:hypothetical protein
MRRRIGQSSKSTAKSVSRRVAENFKDQKNGYSSEDERHAITKASKSAGYVFGQK